MIWPDQWEGSSQLISDCENCCRPFSVYLVMDQGQVVEQNTPEEFFNHPQNERSKDFLSKILGH